jgi:hypothetical protein
LDAVTYYNKICCTHTTRRLGRPLLWSLVLHLALLAVLFLPHGTTPAPQGAMTVELGEMVLPVAAAAAPASAPAQATPSTLPMQPLPPPVPRMSPQMVQQLMSQLVPQMAQRRVQQTARPPAVSTMPVMPRLNRVSPSNSSAGSTVFPGGGVPFHSYSGPR